MKSNIYNNMKRITLLFIISLSISGVFGDKDERVSVNDGDSVTLHTHTDLKDVNVTDWRFNGDLIARINGDAKDTRPVYDDKRFTDRLKMNPQTGDLTITHITSEHTGVYQLEIIINNKIITKSFSVSLSPEVKNVINKDSVSLHIDVTEKQRNDKIHWKIKHKNSLVAEIITQNGKITENETYNGFRGILKLNDQTGDLIITNMKNEDAGQYEADVTISNTYTIHNTFCFVHCGLSSGEIAGICFLVLVVIVAAVVGVVIYRRRKMNHQVPNTGEEPVDTQQCLSNGDISNDSNRGNESAVINGSLNQL